MSNVKHLRFPLRGFRYRVTEGTMDQMATAVPMPVTFRRDSINPHDANAVAVFLDKKPWIGFHVGYVPRDIAALLAPKMDSGQIEMVEGTLENLDGDEGDISVTVRKPRPRKKSKARA
jgi:hypothetical protein